MARIRAGGMTRRSRAWIAALAGVALLVPIAFAGPAPAAGGDIVTFADPNNLIQGPTDIAASLDGKLWFTSLTNNAIGSITTDGTIEMFALDNADPGEPPMTEPRDITLGPDGKMWFTLGGEVPLGRIDPVTRHIDAFPDPDDSFEDPSGIVGLGEFIWVANTGFDGLVQVNLSGQVDTSFDQMLDVDAPDGITADAQGTLWFTSTDNDRIAHFNPQSGFLETFTDPNKMVDNPVGITADREQNVWFTSLANDRIGRINAVGEITTYTGPGVDAPFGIAIGPGGGPWFTNLESNRVGCVTTFGQNITTFGSPEVAVPAGIAIGPDDNLWFTSVANDRIGQVKPPCPSPAPTTTTTIAGPSTDPIPPADPATPVGGNPRVVG